MQSKKATERAEMMSGIAVNKAYVGISGGSSCGLNSEGAVQIRDRKVKASDVDKVINSAGAQSISEGHKIATYTPKRFFNRSAKRHLRNH